MGNESNEDDWASDWAGLGANEWLKMEVIGIH